MSALAIGGLVFTLALVLLWIPVGVFVLELACALAGRGNRADEKTWTAADGATTFASTGTAVTGAACTGAAAGTRPALAVLIPAHDEGSGIVATLASVAAQLRPGERMLVVADNCSDDTAAQARAGGADVIERHDSTRRGKGYALDAGVRALAVDGPPALVVIVDADCLLAPHALERLARRCAQTGRPVQALYLMRAPAGSGIRTRIAEFAWTVKNHARALGLARAGLPCQLMGSGMAFPWPLIAGAALASADLVEDLRLGLDFARQRKAPLFCPEAVVTSEFPVNAQGLQSQRRRWEHGHLAMLLRDGPGLLRDALRTRNGELCALTLDLCVPPLALLVLLALAVCVLGAAMWAIAGAALPWSLALAAPLLLALAVLAAWARFGRAILSGAELAYAPIYALRKIPLYLAFLVRRQVSWVRSARDRP